MSDGTGVRSRGEGPATGTVWTRSLAIRTCGQQCRHRHSEGLRFTYQPLNLCPWTHLDHNSAGKGAVRRAELCMYIALQPIVPMHGHIHQSRPIAPGKMGKSSRARSCTKSQICGTTQKRPTYKWVPLDPTLISCIMRGDSLVCHAARQGVLRLGPGPGVGGEWADVIGACTWVVDEQGR